MGGAKSKAPPTSAPPPAALPASQGMALESFAGFKPKVRGGAGPVPVDGGEWVQTGPKNKPVKPKKPSTFSRLVESLAGMFPDIDRY